MKLETGEELYEYLQGKTQQEIEDYFVSRGAKMINGIMFNNGLYCLYQIEKEARENLDNGKRWAVFDGEIDGLER